MTDYVLKTYFIRYLKEIRKVSDSTIKHYQESLRYISRFLVLKHKINDSIYEIQNIAELEIIKEYLYSDIQFLELDERGHRMYSAGFNHHLRFAQGEHFSEIGNNMKNMDVVVPAQKQKSAIHTGYQRIHGKGSISVYT